MNEKRRATLLALLSGAVAGVALVAARRGVPGASKMAARLVKPMQPQAKTETYGYKEVKLS